MCLLESFIMVRGNPSNLKYYRELGYNITNKEHIKIRTIDLPKSSKVKVKCVCDTCGSINESSYQNLNKITNNLEEKYYCKKCKYIKIKESNIERYGVCSTLSLKSVKDKIAKTNIERYGDIYPSKSKLIQDKTKITNLKRYGVEYTFKSEKIKDKIAKTNIERYGDIIPMRNENISNKLKQSVIINENKKYRNLIPNEYSIIDYDKMSIMHNNCGEITNINRKNVYFRLNRGYSLCDFCKKEISKPESEIKDIIESYGVYFIENDRDILNGKELDIYIPSLNLAIEFNGLYWHSELHKSKDYHLNKTIECGKKGIQLLHIFEDDWDYKHDIVKSIIRNKLGKIDNKIYARKTEVREVKSHIAREFLDMNHIQGFSRSTYKLGLYYDNELVSLMTFGYRKTNSKKEFELIRFCNKLDTNVVGASSKLFKYFLNNYKIEESYILSYADISLFDGQMYDTLGFDEIHLTKPNYFWVVNKKREHRWKYNKQNLIKEGYNKDMTEVEIMHSRNYYRIYGCGQKRYEYYL